MIHYQQQVQKVMRALLPERLPEPDDEEGGLRYDDVMRGGMPDDRYLVF